MEEVDRQPLSVTICSICKLRNPPIGENWKRICWRALARGTLARGTRQRRASQRRTGPQGSVHLRPPRCPATAALTAPRRLRVRVGPRGRGATRPEAAALRPGSEACASACVRYRRALLRWSFSSACLPRSLRHGEAPIRRGGGRWAAGFAWGVKFFKY